MTKQNIRKLIIAFTCLIIYASSQAQVQDTVTYKVKWSDRLNVPYQQEIEPFKMTNDFLLFKSWKFINEDVANQFFPINRPHLYRVDLMTNQVIDKLIILTNGKQRRALEKIMYLNNTIHIFSSFINSQQKKYYLFDETVNEVTLELNNDTRKICEIDFGALEKAKSGTLTTDIILQNEGILLTSSIYTKAGKSFFYNFFDLQMKPLADYCFLMGNPASSISATTFDHLDNLYILEGYWNKEEENMQYIIHFLSKDKSALKQKSIDGIKFTSNIKLDVNPKNELICVGLFAKPKQYGPIGAFSLIFPAQLNGNGIKHTTEFPKELIVKGLRESEKKEIENKMLNNLDFNNRYNSLIETMKVSEKGDFTFVCERYKGAQISSLANSNSNTFQFNYNDIYVLSCRDDGSFKWQDKIARNQELYNFDLLNGHYVPFFDLNDCLNIVYSNFDESKFLSSNAKSAQIFLVTFDSNGNRTDKTLISNSVIATNFSPYYSKFVDKENLIMTLFGFEKTNVKYVVGAMQIQPTTR